MMLDTNICIYLMNSKDEKLLTKFKEHQDDLKISSITLGELQYGVYHSSRVEQNAIALLNFLALIEVVNFDDNAALEYGNVRAYIKSIGKPIGPLDMLIAGHALSLGETLVTNNVKEFIRVPNLKIENWV